MCKSRCHAPGGCPACTAVLERRCECGRNVERRPCKMASSALRGSLDSEWKVACTADCLHAQRLEILSGLVPAPAQSHPVKYSFFLWDAALTSSANVQAIERQLVDFVQSGTTFKALPPMPAEKRALVHALSHYFHIKSESVDGGALRSCLLRRTPNTRIPEPRLTVATSDPQRHSPQDFTNEIRARDDMMQKQVIVASGCGVTVIAVQHALQEFAGEFVCEEECRNEDTDGDIRVFFTTPKKRAQALTHLRNITPPFRFSCPPSNKKDACSTSWASAVSSKTAKLPFRLDKWR
ncbi:hypothetical protein TRVL_04888 [Trypanosoma vivax]|nr:hypothetical protein TRVL_04888 [Trypanosoma vivax]